MEKNCSRVSSLVRQRDQVIRPEEDVELACVEPADRLVVDREVQNREEVALLDVVVDLRPLPLGENVLDVECVPAEAVGEPFDLLFRRRVEVDPRQPTRLELAETPPLSRRRDDDVAGAARTSDAGKARHRDWTVRRDARS